MELFTVILSEEAIGALALGSGSSCLASPSSGGMDFCSTVFTPHVLVNYVYSAVLEVAA